MNDRAGQPDPLSAANDAFHDAYGGNRDALREQVPILVVLPTQLVLRQRDQRREIPYSQPLFTRAKTAAHVAVALFALTAAEAGSSETSFAVERLLEHISAADTSNCGPRSDEIDALLDRCRGFARALRDGQATESTRATFASDAGARILRITELATREQIAGLHGAVETILAQLSADEQHQLQVVVVGDHQARARSLGMQYFKRRFREGTPDERVTYGENVDNEEEAIALVATRRLDQRIALAFFGDEHRLQRDVLGDAAKRCLDQMGFPS